MQYDLGYLSTRSKAWFTSHALDAPSSFKTPGKKLVAVSIKKPQAPVLAVLLLPDLFHNIPPAQQNQQAISAALVEHLPDIQRKAQQLRQAHSFIIAISTWGLTAEKELLNLLPPGTLDVLLGGGPGYYFSQVVDQGLHQVVWVRPLTQGKAVHTIDFFQLPAPPQKLSLMTQFTSLSGSFTAEQTMERLLAPLEEKAVNTQNQQHTIPTAKNNR